MYKVLFYRTCLVLLFLQEAHCQNYDRVKVGDTCPEFIVSCHGEKREITPLRLKGKVTLINFFATWCKPCVEELPEIQQKIWEKYKNNKAFDLIIIGRQHTELEVEAFKSRHKFDMPMYADSTRAIYDQFAVSYIPRNYIVNEKGIIVYASVNYNEYEFQKILIKLEDLLK